jgi:exoribonuclease-2
MLPDALVQHYTLQEGRSTRPCPLYVTMDEATLITATATRLEQVPIAANLPTTCWTARSQSVFLKRPTPAHRQTWPGARTAFLHRLARHQGRARSGARQT